ncbi:metabolite traffic protein EboE [Deinococcus hopiensis]|uniref:Xylose isomerase-like TIM barrel n=1 Tax=Deinococcus hopiensis KR-140 TaxID=695939 RepID=A0A1W1U9I4_9DEIO|nr:metabolite traffic protein EboE [Deinococcus hopiensis]SMB77702.1 hypothetical protein SAMN00790413_03869 [Deinococcus hopiensis KR-140]
MRFGDLHLTYCMNVHPTGNFEDLLHTLREVVLPLKEDFSPDLPFGLGLWIPGAEAAEVLRRIGELQEFLRRHGLYVFTMNGFPYGTFHGTRVKEQVHHPDWRTRDRVEYTLRLAQILATLLPDGVQGSISTSPLSYRTWVDGHDAAVWTNLLEHLLEVVVELHRLRTEQGKTVVLCLEPEPDGLLGTTAELLDFAEDHLLSSGVQRLSTLLNVAEGEARTVLLRHLGGCLDTCHLAVGYEKPLQVLQRYRDIGFQVGKIQLSSALKVTLPQDRSPLREALQSLDDPTYLHQVVALRQSGDVQGYQDLPSALQHLDDPAAVEWRVHFHVPLFVEHFGKLTSTQQELREVLNTLPLWQCNHLEVETYTWQVLPEGMRLPLRESLLRELRWVQRVLT